LSFSLAHPASPTPALAYGKSQSGSQSRSIEAARRYLALGILQSRPHSGFHFFHLELITSRAFFCVFLLRIEPRICLFLLQSVFTMASADELKALGNKAIADKNFDEAM
jgi:hypothetical protein